jgi:ATP-dependent DNA helicase PIF1
MSYSRVGPALNDVQAKFVNDFITKGRSCFLTGRAGTGKTTVIEEIIDRIRKTIEFQDSDLIVTGMVGIVASNLTIGETFHSALGLGLATLDKEEYVSRIMADAHLLDRWRKCKVLIVDEVSWMSRSLLEMFDHIARRVRGVAANWGGIQVLFVGDFMQLVAYSREELPFWSYAPEDPKDPGSKSVLKLSADGLGVRQPLWDSLEKFILIHIHRQKEDIAFKAFCNTMRSGQDLFTDKTDEYISNNLIDESKKDWPRGVRPVKLFGRNEPANAENARVLRELPGELHSFKSEDTLGTFSQDEFESGFHTNLLSLLELKVDLPVIFLRNLINEGLVNGSQGTVVGFMSAGELADPAVNTEKYNSVLQLPAVKGLRLPLVEFILKDGSRKRLLVGYTLSSPETPNPRAPPAYSRKQIGLRPASAMTVHRAQGMSLDFVMIDMSSLFDLNHFYTAITRCRTSRGLLLRGYEAFKNIGATIGQPCWKVVGVLHLFDARRYYREVMEPLGDIIASSASSHFKQKCPNKVTAFAKGRCTQWASSGSKKRKCV